MLQCTLAKKEISETADDRTLKFKMDFSGLHKRRVLLKFLYLGWDANGYAIQLNTKRTVEHHLFEALNKLRLIENRESANYIMCGRTDKEVSAFEQVISLDIRSKIDPEEQLTEAGVNSEINYCLSLNKALPKQIRMIAWRPVMSPKYSARFECLGRTYRYFFPRGNLDVQKMQEACKYLGGTHDFRNFCTIDPNSPSQTKILHEANIKLAARNHDGLEVFDMFYLEIKGKSFLRNMVRSIMTILIFVGQGKEPPDVVKRLLDVETISKKPQYGFSRGYPLNLFSTNFIDEALIGNENGKIPEIINKWIFHPYNLKKVITDMQEHWCKQNVKAMMVYEMLTILQNEYSDRFADRPAIVAQAKSLLQDNDVRALMERNKSVFTPEEKLKNMAEKDRLKKVLSNAYSCE